MKDPARDIPRVLNVAMTTVVVSFVLVNIALYAVIPIETMRESSTPVVVRLSDRLRPFLCNADDLDNQDFGVALFGTAGGLIASLIVATSALGALNAHAFATARLCVAAGQRQYFPSILANQHFQLDVPESEYYAEKLQRLPPALQHLILRFASMTVELRCVMEIPMSVAQWPYQSIY
jgi:amino acid transporter